MTSVAVIGCGPWGRNLSRNFAGLGALAAVCDIDPDRADRVASEHGVATRPFQEILSDPGIDAVVIATSVVTHYRWARQALEASKHTFVEKPLALRVTEAERLSRIAATQGRVLMVGHLLQYHPAFARLHSLVQEGALGRLQYVYSNRLNLGKVRREENALWSFAPHDISMILSLVGSEPVGVTATGGAFLKRDVADVTMTSLTFAGDERAHAFVSWLHPFKEQKLIVIGDNGMAVFDDGQPWERKLVRYPYEVSWERGLPRPVSSEAVPEPVTEEEPLRLECEHFLTCIQSGAAPLTDGAEGVRVLRVLARAQRSLEKSVVRRQATV